MILGTEASHQTINNNGVIEIIPFYSVAETWMVLSNPFSGSAEGISLTRILSMYPEFVWLQIPGREQLTANELKFPDFIRSKDGSMFPSNYFCS